MVPSPVCGRHLETSLQIAITPNTCWWALTLQSCNRRSKGARLGNSMRLSFRVLEFGLTLTNRPRPTDERFHSGMAELSRTALLSELTVYVSSKASCGGPPPSQRNHIGKASQISQTTIVNRYLTRGMSKTVNHTLLPLLKFPNTHLPATSW